MPWPPLPLSGRDRWQQQTAHTVQWLGHVAVLRPCTPPRDTPNHRSWEPRHGAKMTARARALCRCSPPVAPRALACAAAARPPRHTTAQADMLAPGTMRQRPLLLCKCWRAESGVVQAGREGEAGAVDGAAEAMLPPLLFMVSCAVGKREFSRRWVSTPPESSARHGGVRGGRRSMAWRRMDPQPCLFLSTKARFGSVH